MKSNIYFHLSPLENTPKKSEGFSYDSFSLQPPIQSLKAQTLVLEADLGF
jgi:hypothetical protein